MGEDSFFSGPLRSYQALSLVLKLYFAREVVAYSEPVMGSGRDIVIVVVLEHCVLNKSLLIRSLITQSGFKRTVSCFCVKEPKSF